MCIAFLVFGLAWLTFGTLTLTEGDTGPGVVKLALGIGWLLAAAWHAAGRPGGRRSGAQ
jgi:hypothetical protein